MSRAVKLVSSRAGEKKSPSLERSLIMTSCPTHIPIKYRLQPLNITFQSLCEGDITRFPWEPRHSKQELRVIFNRSPMNDLGVGNTPNLWNEPPKKYRVYSVSRWPVQLFRSFFCPRPLKKGVIIPVTEARDSVANDTSEMREKYDTKWPIGRCRRKDQPTPQREKFVDSFTPNPRRIHFICVISILTCVITHAWIVMFQRRRVSNGLNRGWQF